MSYCSHILSHQVLDFVPSKSIRVQFQAIDPTFVKRTDKFKVVAGWYTWLSLDMACALLVDMSGHVSLTEKFDLTLAKTYRYPDVIAQAEITDMDQHYFYINASLHNSGGGLLANANVKMKMFQLEDKND